MCCLDMKALPWSKRKKLETQVHGGTEMGSNASHTPMLREADTSHREMIEPISACAGIVNPGYIPHKPFCRERFFECIAADSPWHPPRQDGYPRAAKGFAASNVAD